jgi:hypothetical protein
MDARIPCGTSSWNPTLAHRTRKDGAPGRWIWIDTFQRNTERDLGFASDSRLSSAPDDSLGDLSPEERGRYLRFWRRFKMLDTLGWVGLGILVFVGLLGAHLPGNGWRYFSLTWLALVAVTAIWIRLLPCPRCGVKFWGGLLTLLPRAPGMPPGLGPFYIGKCWGCDLSRKQLSDLAKYE